MSNDAELYPGGTASGTTSTFGDMLRQNMRSAVELTIEHLREALAKEIEAKVREAVEPKLQQIISEYTEQYLKHILIRSDYDLCMAQDKITVVFKESNRGN